MSNLGLNSTYSRKPAASVRPDFGHSLAEGLQLFMPFNEGAGAPRAWINGAYKQADTDGLQSTANWTIDQYGMVFQPTTINNEDSYLIWNNFNPRIGSGPFEYMVATRISNNNSSAFTAGIGTYDPGLLALRNQAQVYWYWGADLSNNDTVEIGNFIIGSVRRRDTGTNGCAVEFYVHNLPILKGPGLHTRTNTAPSNTTFNFNCADGTGDFNGHDNYKYYWLALWNRHLSDAERFSLYYNPDAIWQIYSRPLPIFISSGAPPVGWQGTINEISAPASVNEISNITSVNEKV